MSFMTLIYYPTGYTSTVMISILTLNVSLSNDSNTLTIISSLGSYCGVEAFREFSIVETTATTTNTTTTRSTNVCRNAAAEQYVNILILFSLAFLSVLIIF
jgi:hypothetical protein